MKNTTTMKKNTLIAFALLVSAFAASAEPVVEWAAVPDVDGYRLYCGPTPILNPTVYDSAATSYDLAGLLLDHTEYECWVTAYAGTRESAQSDHLVFTPTPHQTIVLPAVPSGITVTW